MPLTVCLCSRTKDGQDVKAGGRVRFLYEDDESMSMIIKGVTPEDAGTYTVTAWNDMGEDFAEVTLNVKGESGTRPRCRGEGSTCLHRHGKRHFE